MNKFLFLSSMSLLCFMIFVSCSDKNSPDNNSTDNNSTNNELKSGGTFKITASTGTTKILNLSNTGNVTGSFWVNSVKNTSSVDNSKVFDLTLSGKTDAGEITLEVYISNNPQLDVNYSVVSNDERKQGYTGNYIGFGTWVETVGVSKETIQFSRFQYPGRITATIINYDAAGKVLATGDLDFISVKPQI